MRDRLVKRLSDPDSFVLGRVVAPAGSGKSRLLAQVARVYAGPVAWCGTPDPVPRTEASFVGWVDGALSSALAEHDQQPASTVDMLVRASRVPTDHGHLPVLLVVDDAHLMEDSDAESALSELASRVPRWLRLVIATRVTLALDLSRLRVAGGLVDIGHDDLRFRTWEVEELFRDVYRDPLVPEDVGALARRTGGWAAYLQLFHLATAQKPQGVRRKVLNTLSTQSRLVQEYLSRHVLSELSLDLQDFLIRTCVLRRPTAEMCDELLGPGKQSDGQPDGQPDRRSAELLAEVERRQLLTERSADGSYRYHTVLLSFLEAQLVERIGSTAARDQHRIAAAILEKRGHAEDALAAYAKSADWEGVARVLGHASERSTDVGEFWLEALPPTVIATDATLLMARARRVVSSGDLDEAIRIMKDAEKAAVSSSVAEYCRRERELVSAWASPDRVDPGRGGEWALLIRAATQRNPLGVQLSAAEVAGGPSRFAEGMAALMAGDFLTTARVLRVVASAPDAPSWMAAAARLVAVVASAVVGSPPEDGAVERARDEVESAGVPWLSRISRVALSISERDDEEVFAEYVEACEREGDRWGVALVSFVTGMAALASGRPDPTGLERATRTFSDLGAGVQAAWAAGFQALAAHQTGKHDVARKAAALCRSLSSSLQVEGASAVACLAFGLINQESAEVERARAILSPLGMWRWSAVCAGLAGGALPSSSNDSGPEQQTGQRSPAAPAELQSREATPVVAAHGGANPSPDAWVEVRCLGEFYMAVDGRAIDESAAKPMERALLHLLAMRAGERVHREQILEALWPDADPDAGRHRLQVAVSAVRKLLGNGNSSRLLARDGDSYILRIPPGSEVDVWKVEQFLRRAAQARRSDDTAAEEAALEAVLASCGGTLLPMEGPADWVVGARDRLQAAAADSAIRLSTIRLVAGDLTGAADAARRGLDFDRYRDELWRLSIEAAERSGHQAEAGRARKAYADVLDELGV